MHTHTVKGTFMVAFSQSTYTSLENNGEAEVCVVAVSLVSELSSPVTVLVVTESATATDTGNTASNT